MSAVSRRSGFSWAMLLGMVAGMTTAVLAERAGETSIPERRGVGGCPWFPVASTPSQCPPIDARFVSVAPARLSVPKAAPIGSKRFRGRPARVMAGAATVSHEVSGR